METSPVQMREDLKWFEPHPDEHIDNTAGAHLDDDWSRGWE